MALLLMVTAPFDYDPATNTATISVSADSLAGTDMAITELGQQALPICSHGIRVRFADQFGQSSPTFDLSLALMAASGDIFAGTIDPDVDLDFETFYKDIEVLQDRDS